MMLICCPRCRGTEISSIDDYEYNLLIFKCNTCGEMYSVTNKDYFNLGVEQIFKEWHRGYRNEPKALK